MFDFFVLVCFDSLAVFAFAGAKLWLFYGVAMIFCEFFPKSVRQDAAYATGF